MIETSIKGAFLFGAVYFAGLMAGGLYMSRFAFLCGLVGVGAAYLTQVFDAFYRMADENLFARGALAAWAVSAISGVVGLFALMGG